MEPIDIIKSYPYLFATLGGGLIVLSLGRFFLSPQQWYIMILSGFLSIPCFPFLVFLEKEYWNPIRFGGWVLGIEDVLCSFWVAAMVWFVVAVPLGKKMSINSRIQVSWLRYFTMTSFSTLLFFLFYLADLGGMGSLFLAYLIVTAYLLRQVRNPWLLCLIGIILFPVLYLLEVKLFFWIWPYFRNQWNTQSFWGLSFLGIPRGETTWAVIFGVYWPLFIAYVFGLQPSPRRSAT